MADLCGLPDRLEEVLEAGPASVLAVNPWGTLLAVGRPDGGLALFDLQTRGLAAAWSSAHSGASGKQASAGSGGANGAAGGAAGSRVTALLWSASGRALLSGAADGSVTAWDVLTGTPVRRIAPPDGSGGSGTVVRLAWAGQQQRQEAVQGLVLASMAAGPARLLCLATGQAQPLPMLTLGTLGLPPGGMERCAAACSTSSWAVG